MEKHMSESLISKKQPSSQAIDQGPSDCALNAEMTIPISATPPRLQPSTHSSGKTAISWAEPPVSHGWQSGAPKSQKNWHVCFHGSVIFP